MTTDPKQPIYNAMNWMGGVMQSSPPDDSEMIIKAYEKVYQLPDKETQQAFLDVIQRLTFRNHRMTSVVKAWEKSTEQLREACRLIENQQSENVERKRINGITVVGNGE